MKRRARSATKKRKYDNRFRSQQADATKDRIVEAVGEVLVEGAPSDLSLIKVAERADVSPPTIYRHFPAKEDLLKAFAGLWRRTVGDQVGQAVDLDNLDDYVDAAFRFFDEHDALVRAGLTPEGAQMVRSSRKQTDALGQALRKVVDQLKPKQAAATKALMAHLLGPATWKALRDDHGLSSHDAIEVVGWAARALVGELRRADTRKERRAR